jgi:hypothetical protein
MIRMWGEAGDFITDIRFCFGNNHGSFQGIGRDCEMRHACLYLWLCSNIERV